MPEEGRSKRFGYEAEIEGNLEEGLKGIRSAAADCAEAFEGIMGQIEGINKTLVSASEAADQAAQAEIELAKGAVKASAALYATREALFGLLGPMGDLQWTLVRYGPVLSAINVSSEAFARRMLQSSRNVAGMVDVVRTFVPTGITSTRILTEMSEQAYRLGAMTGEGAQSAAAGLRDIVIGLRATQEQVESLTLSAYKMSEAAATSIRGLGEFVKQVGFLGQRAGFTNKDIMMLGTVAQASGLGAAEAAGMFSKMSYMMRYDMALLAQVAGARSQEMAVAMLTDPMEAMRIFLQTLEEAPPYMELFFKEAFGIERLPAFIQFGRAFQQLEEHIKAAGDEVQGFKNWLEATGQWTQLLRIELVQLRQSVTNLVMGIARYAAPVVAGITRGIREIMEALSSIPEPIKVILSYAGVAVGLIATFGTIQIAVGGLLKIVTALAGASSSLFALIPGVGPIAIAILGALGFKLMDIVATTEKVGDIGKRINEMFSGIGETIGRVWSAISPFVEVLYNMLVGTLLGIAVELYGIGKEFGRSLEPMFDFLGVQGNNLLEWLEAMGSKLRDIFTVRNIALAVQWAAHLVTLTIMDITMTITRGMLEVKRGITDIIGAIRSLREEAEKTGELMASSLTKGVAKGVVRGTAEVAVETIKVPFEQETAAGAFFGALSGDWIPAMNAAMRLLGDESERTKQKMRGSSFLGLQEGISGALPEFDRLVDRFDSLSGAVDRLQALKPGPTIATTRPEPSRYFVRRGGVEEGFAVPAVVVTPTPVVNVEASAPPAMVETVGPSGEEIPTVNVPITVVLDGRVIAEALVEHQAIELMRRHRAVYTPRRGVGVG